MENDVEADRTLVENENSCDTANVMAFVLAQYVVSLARNYGFVITIFIGYRSCWGHAVV